MPINLFGRNRGPSQREQFEMLVQPHFGAMYAAARRMTGSHYDAEDLVQEVCMKALDRLDELEEIEFPRAWLLKVVYNEFVDTYRRGRRSPLGAAGEVEDPDTLAAESGRPDDLVDREQQMDRVIDAMRLLDRDDCALVALHDLEGLSIAELCHLTGMPEGTIKAKLHRTRTKLGRLLYNDQAPRPSLKVIGGTQ